MPPKYKVHERIARTSSNASFDGGPDGKKYERVVKEIDQEIGTRETKLRALQQVSTLSTDPRLRRQAAILEGLTRDELAEEREKIKDDIVAIGAEQKVVEENIKEMSVTIGKKIDQSSRLKRELQYFEEEPYVTTIKRFQEQLSSRTFAAAEERKILKEIEQLKRSKEDMKHYKKLEEEISEMKTNQEGLRQRRTKLFHNLSDLKLKEKILHRQASFEEETGLNSKKDIAMEKVKLREEISRLLTKRKQYTEEFKKQQELFIASQKERRQKEKEEKEKKVEEKRWKEVERKSKEFLLRKRDDSDCETVSLEEMASTKGALVTLISFLSSINLPPEDTSPFNGYGEEEVDGPKSSPVSVGVARNTAWEGPSGELYQKRNKEEEGYYQPKGLQRRRSKKEKRHSAIPKLTRNIQFTPVMLQQFASVDVRPPLTYGDILPVVKTLKDKMASCETAIDNLKRQSLDIFEGTDSGIVSVEHSDSELPSLN